MNSKHPIEQNADTPQAKLDAFLALVDEVAPEHAQKNMAGTVMFFYKSQLLVAYSLAKKSLTILTSGRTPNARRKLLKPYMTLTGNIRIKNDQTLPTSDIRTILLERKNEIEQHPNKKSAYTWMPPARDPSLSRHEKTSRRVAKLEEKFPALQKATKHPKLQHWIVPIATVLEVTIGMLAALIVMPWLISLLELIPTPNINLPDIPLPSINLPNWNLPFTIPKLPDWLETTLHWFKKTLPIWIAVAIALHAIRKQKSQ